MRSLAVVCALAAVASADGKSAVRELPELGTIARGRTRVVVRGDVAQRARVAMVALVDQVVADVQRRFLASAGDPHPAITLCLLADNQRYRDVAGAFGPIPSDWGFYLPRERVGIANVGVSIGNLRHELVHPLIGDDFPNVPAWLNEGLGSLYGTARYANGRFEFLVNYRLRDLQRALRDGKLPSLAELAASRYEDVTGPRASIYYAYARYVLLYLDRRGTLPKFYADMRAASGDTATQRKLLETAVDERAFRTWAAALKL